MTTAKSAKVSVSSPRTRDQICGGDRLELSLRIGRRDDGQTFVGGGALAAGNRRAIEHRFLERRQPRSARPRRRIDEAGVDGSARQPGQELHVVAAGARPLIER